VATIEGRYVYVRTRRAVHRGIHVPGADASQITGVLTQERCNLDSAKTQGWTVDEPAVGVRRCRWCYGD
jgi:hypothetical protein